MTKSLTLSLAGLLLLGGCATPPSAEDVKAKTFAPTPGRANVYVYRDEHLGGIVRMAVAVNGKQAGLTRGRTYLLLQLEPGRHKITSQEQDKTSVTLDVAAGQNYFVWQEVKHTFGTFHYRSQLKLVDEVTGRAGVNECELADQEKMK